MAESPLRIVMPTGEERLATWLRRTRALERSPAPAVGGGLALDSGAVVGVAAGSAEASGELSPELEQAAAPRASRSAKATVEDLICMVTFSPERAGRVLGPGRARQRPRRRCRGADSASGCWATAMRDSGR